MKNKSRYINFCACIFYFSFNLQGIAGIFAYKFTPPANVDPEGSAYYRIFIPDSIDTIKGIYCYVPGWQGSSLSIVTNPYYQNYVIQKDFALMGFLMTGDYTNRISGISLWSGEALVQALRELSILSGYKELEYSALLFDGYSAGGQFSYHFTQWKPDRVIAFVTMKGGGHSLSPAGNAIKVPGNMYIGENDLEYRLTNLTYIFETNRPMGALWALAVEPDAGHTRVAREIVHSFFDQIIPLRLPETIPEDTIPQLNELDEKTGWLGDRETYEIKFYPEYAEDKSLACWFQNEKNAKEWQNFVQGKPFPQVSIINYDLPEKSELFQNYPNPFNPSTTIEFTLPKSDFTTLKVYNILGKEVATLVSKKLNQGHHTQTWNASNFASGVYYYRIQAGNFIQTRKMIYLK